MPKSDSADLRQRVVDAVASGASRHEAAELFGIAVSTAIKWWQRWRDTRSVAPKPRGGSTSPLDEHTTARLEANQNGGGVHGPAFKPLQTWEGLRKTAKVSNRTREIW